MSTKAVPLTEFEIEEWRKLLDTLMHDASLGTTIRWKQELRALATIDALCTINRDLLAALKAMLTPCPPETHAIGPDGECPECDVEKQAHAAIALAEHPITS